MCEVGKCADCHVTKWEHYRDTRKGTYQFRASTRYSYVAQLLLTMGLNDYHTVIDVGAGTCGFGRFLRSAGWRGIYIPVDAVVCGEDLETWRPTHTAEFYVAIETLEHIHKPYDMIRAMAAKSTIGIALTTPNPAAVDAVGCDPTHRTALHGEVLRDMQMAVRAVSWFGTEADTLVAFGRVPLGELY